MASPITATRLDEAARSSAPSRSRERERGMGGNLAVAGSERNRAEPSGHNPCPLRPRLAQHSRPPGATHDPDRTRLPAFLTRLNDAAKAKVLTLQEYFVLAGKSLRFIVARPFYGQDVVQQMDEIGVKSLGIVLLTGLFTGMVLALQSSVQLKTFGATMYIGNLVAASMIRELGPVLAGLMVAGRVGSGIAAQLGSMRVTEQIDALNTLGTDPIKKLVTPRVLAALIMLPVLTIINDFVGIIGGNIIAAFVIGLPS